RFALPPALAGSITILGDPFPTYRLFLAVFGAVVALALWQFLERTRLGLLVRATAQNAEMVHALGTDVHRVRAGVFALGCALAALGGVMAVPLVTAYLGLGVGVVVDAVGSVILGVVQTFGNYYLPDLALAAVYLAMIAVLVFRPAGLFGQRE